MTGPAWRGSCEFTEAPRAAEPDEGVSSAGRGCYHPSNIALRGNDDVSHIDGMASVSFELPNELLKQLKSSVADLAVEAKEALAVKLFREKKLNHRQLSEVLGLDRFETDAVLKRHEVVERSLTFQNLEIEQIGRAHV